MSIPLYFAADCKEFVTIQKNQQKALTGFGVLQDGSIRLPQEILPGVAVIDDADITDISPQKDALDILAAHCAQGCYFDFMRPVTKVHIDILHGVTERLPEKAPCFVPEAYHSIVPSSVCVVTSALPQNSWVSWCAKIQSRYPAGWCLELVPWDTTVSYFGSQKTRHIDAACCIAQGGHYYDTKATLLERISVAERYRCIAAIALYQEWNTLK